MRFLEYIFGTNLDNSKTAAHHEESGENMSINKAKIRRQVIINGNKVWVSGNTEQEYADHLLKLANSENNKSESKHLFRDFAENWFKIFSKPNISEATAETYYRQLTLHIYPAIGNMYIEDITVSDIQKIFNRLDNDCKLETKKKIRVVLNQIFKMAHEEAIIFRNPMKSSSLKVRGAASSETAPYTVDEMRYFASHLKDIRKSRDRAWFALSISLPLRPEEVLGLKWEDLDDDTGILHIRNTVTHPSRNAPLFKPYTKTASSRRDLMLPESIRKFLPEREEDDKFIVGGQDPVSYTMLRRMRENIAKDINFDGKIIPRKFRTTVATDISAETHDLKLVQHMLGHSTPQMTLKHYDKGRNNVVDAANAIEKCYHF